MGFGARIKSLRNEKGWSQEYVCEKTHISPGALSRYENEVFEPKSLELVKDFANLFDVSTDYLLGKSDIRNPEDVKIDNDKLRIGLSTKDYENITDEQKKQIEDFAKFVLKDNKKKEN